MKKKLTTQFCAFVAITFCLGADTFAHEHTSMKQTTAKFKKYKGQASAAKNYVKDSLGLTVEQQKKWSDFTNNLGNTPMNALQQKLNLSPAQVSQIQNAVSSSNAEIAEVKKNNSLTANLKEAAIAQIKQKLPSIIATYLTPAQKTKFESLTGALSTLNTINSLKSAIAGGDTNSSMPTNINSLGDATKAVTETATEAIKEPIKDIKTEVKSQAINKLNSLY